MNYILSITDNVLAEDIQIPSMVIQPYIENAVKHGIQSVQNKLGLLKIDFQLIHNKLVCTIDDNG